MNEDQIIEQAIQGHASTRDAIRWAMQQERYACAKVCEQLGMATNGMNERNHECATAIRARGIDGARVGEVGVWGEK